MSVFKLFLKRYWLISGLFLFILLPSLASAQAIQAQTAFGPFASVGELIAHIVKNYATPFAALAALLMITYAGAEYIQSGGNPEALTKAKELIIGAVLGLLTIFMMGLVLKNLLPEDSLTGSTSTPTATAPTTPAGPSFSIATTSFKDNQTIPKANICKDQGGQNIAPTLTISNLPTGTKKVNLQVTDSDASSFLHWKVDGVPVTGKTVTIKSSAKDTKPYSGPCPPHSKPHHYHFAVSAIDGQNHQLSLKELVGVYPADPKAGTTTPTTPIKVSACATKPKTSTGILSVSADDTIDLSNCDDSTDPGVGSLSKVADDPAACYPDQHKTSLLTKVGQFFRFNVSAALDCSTTNTVIARWANTEADQAYDQRLIEDPKTMCGPNKYYNYNCPSGQPDLGFRPWCAYFVSWIIRNAVPSANFGVRIAAGQVRDYFKANGIVSSDPRPGDVFWKSRGGGDLHVGIVVGVNKANSTVTVVDGNGKKNPQCNCQMVWRHTLAISEIIGFGRFK